MHTQNNQSEPRFNIFFKKFVIFAVLSCIAGWIAFGQLDIPNIAKSGAALIMLFAACMSFMNFMRVS